MFFEEKSVWLLLRGLSGNNGENAVISAIVNSALGIVGAMAIEDCKLWFCI